MSTKANAFKNNFMYSPIGETPPFCGHQKASVEEQSHYTIIKITNAIKIRKKSKKNLSENGRFFFYLNK